MKIAATISGRALILDSDTAYDVTDHLPAMLNQKTGPWLPALEQGWTQEDLAQIDLDACPVVNLEDDPLEAPIKRPEKIIAAPVNYIDHKVEMSEQKTIAEYGVFLKANTSIIGPDQEVQIPYYDKRTDQEGEFAIVIGRGGRHISREDALSHIFGYTCLLDITVRSTEDRSTRKSFDTFTPIGPHIVTADEIPDPDNLDLKCWVDGELRQETNTSELIFDVAALISYASTIMELAPGDIIATGTPAGVGPISGGSEISVNIERVGTLEVTATNRNAISYLDRPGARLSSLNA